MEILKLIILKQVEKNIKCLNGEKIYNMLLCDGKPDCQFGDDERDCDVILPRYFTCSDGEKIHSKLWCNGKKDCRDGEEEESCDGNRPNYPVYFRCSNKRNIKSMQLCNGKRDCRAGEDERDCDPNPPIYRWMKSTHSRTILEHSMQNNPYVYICISGEIISSVLVCDRNVNCKNGDDESYCMVSPSRICSLLLSLNINNTACSWKMFHRDKVTCDILTFDTKDLHVVNLTEHLCIYELDQCGLIKHNPNGSHLMSCESYVCPEKFKTCPGFYCIPLQYVCDGIWHCPGGTEEDRTYCNDPNCTNMFHCRNSSVCLHLSSVCDENALRECPNGDDELLCDTEFPRCPSNCFYAYNTGKNTGISGE